MRIVESRLINTDDGNSFRFIRVEPGNLQQTLKEILDVIMDLSWISKFDKKFKRDSFESRAKKTIADIQEKFNNCSDDKVTSDAGEYVVSEIARESIVNELGYLDVPLPELFKQKKSGNPGFDFISENEETKTVIFGEAKYNARTSAHTAAIGQAESFAREGKDIEDIADLENLCSTEALNKVAEGHKGFAVAFSTRSTGSDAIIESIQSNEKFKSLLTFEEVIVVAVNI